MMEVAVILSFGIGIQLGDVGILDRISLGWETFEPKYNPSRKL
jgi:hypothetical protein